MKITAIRPNKRIIASLMAVLMILAVFVPFSSAAGRNFSDVPTSHWAYDEIQSAVANGITNGYADNTFRPAASVTNAHFAAFLARAFYKGEYVDTGANPWYKPYQDVLNDHGILYGTTVSNDLSAINSSINRYDMAQMMYNVMFDHGYTTPALGTAESDALVAAQSAMADWKSVPVMYRAAVTNCYALGLLNGYSDGSFHGDYAMNRAQGCVVVCRLKAKIADYGDTSTTTPVTPVDPVKPSEPETPVASEGTLANGKAITEANVKAILADIRAEYPDGTVYQPVGTRYPSNAMPGWTSHDGCNGWAAMVSDMIFGKGTVNPPHVQGDHTAIRPGDIIAGYSSKTNKFSHAWIATSAFDASNDDDGHFDFTSSSLGNNIVDWCDAKTTNTNLNNEEYATNGGFYWVVWTRYPD